MASGAGGEKCGVAFENFSPDVVAAFLKDNIATISEAILKTVVDQKIDGEVFLALDDGSMREIAPLLGDRVKIKKALDIALTKAKKSTYVSFTLCQSKTAAQQYDNAWAAAS